MELGASEPLDAVPNTVNTPDAERLDVREGLVLCCALRTPNAMASAASCAISASNEAEQRIASKVTTGRDNGMNGCRDADRLRVATEAGKPGELSCGDVRLLASLWSVDLLIRTLRHAVKVWANIRLSLTGCIHDGICCDLSSKLGAEAQRMLVDHNPLLCDRTRGVGRNGEPGPISGGSAAAREVVRTKAVGDDGNAILG